jgi:hypothetical protein
MSIEAAPACQGSAAQQALGRSRRTKAKTRFMKRLRAGKIIVSPFAADAGNFMLRARSLP